MPAPHLKRLLIAALLPIAFAAPATAQSIQEIRDSTVVTGTLDETSTKTGRGNPYDCYYIDTEKGSVWELSLSFTKGARQIELWPGLCPEVKQSTTAQPMKTSQAQWTRYTLKFVSGGGYYAVIAVALPGGGQGPYTLDIKRLPQQADSGSFPAGFAMKPWMRAGWKPTTASTTATPSADSHTPGTALRDCDDACPEMVVLPAGRFFMGSSAEEEGRHGNEGPRHAVTFAHPFAVGRHEVTFDQYDACVAAQGCPHRAEDNGWGRGRRPANHVSFEDALHYAAWLSEKTGQRYHLLSEAEWEYAARAGMQTPWHTGEAILSEDANILNTFGKTVPVGGFPPNAFGLHDMHGNVSEWVLDCLDTGYFGVPVDGSAYRTPGCKEIIFRGGGYPNEPTHARSARRRAGLPDTRAADLGFRVARSL